MDGRFIDAVEAKITTDMYGNLILEARGRGKDIPPEWYPMITQHLLMPVNSGNVVPVKGHVFGAGNLEKVIDLKEMSTFWRLLNLRIIPEETYWRMGG